MENVTIVGTEDDVLVLATASGERFALPADDVLHAHVRRAKARREERAPTLAASPREIQAQIRAGMSAAEVAELLGVDREVVERFEGAVLAEREHMLGQALAVPVLIGSDLEPDAQPTFGVAIRAKLTALSAVQERWAAWKEESGWIIKLEFSAGEVEHDARWSFDPRRSALSPSNPDATQLSRQGALPEGLIPRLRALDPDRPSPYKDDSRFDSGAFGPRLIASSAPAAEEPVEAEPAPRSASPAQEAATKRAALAPSTPSDTADLLEALRRRRGQREPRPHIEDEPDRSRPLALFEALEPGYEPERTVDHAAIATAATSDQDGPSRRRRREMPSWDEIVFGARGDD